jgi:hypothetical protein
MVINRYTPMDYDTFRTQGNTWTCEYCGNSYTDSDGGCDCDGGDVENGDSDEI